jgi:hypothetical protein
MIQRCFNPETRYYDRYGGRGITVCESWWDLPTFLEDVGLPSPGLSLERIDNDGHYCPENCKWATAEEQNGNTSRCKQVTWRGETMTIKEWGRKLDMSPRRISERLRRGWDIDRAMTTPCPLGYEEGRRRHLENSARLNREKGAVYTRRTRERRRAKGLPV